MTLLSYVPEISQSVSLSRPMSVLDEEITGDICSDNISEKSEEVEVSFSMSKSINPSSQIKQKYASRLLLSRLPGQVSSYYWDAMQTYFANFILYLL